MESWMFRSFEQYEGRRCDHLRMWQQCSLDLQHTENLQNYGGLVPDAGRYTPPELAKSGWDAIKRNPLTAVDAYNFGTLIFEVFNGDFMSGDQAGQTKNIPPTMHSTYRRLVNANTKARVSVGNFLEQ